MTPDHDRAVNPRWPQPTDGPTARARRIAAMYRAHLARLDPSATATCDELAARHGERWMLPHLDHTPDDDCEVTTAQAAALVGVSVRTVRNWACSPHPNDPGRPLLPRAGRDGRETTYLAGNVRRAAAATRRNRT